MNQKRHKYKGKIEGERFTPRSTQKIRFENGEQEVFLGSLDERLRRKQFGESGLTHSQERAGMN